MTVLLAQAIAQYRDDSKVNNRLIKALAEALNGGVRPDWVVREKKERQHEGRIRVCHARSLEE